MHKVLFLLFGCLAITTNAQELNCNVVVNAQLTGNENVQIFKTLERQITEFVNSTQWTKRSFNNQERIDCSMVINVQDYSVDTFQATIQVQSSRPVFGSSYNSPVYNFNDRNFAFQYLEFQNLVFNPDRFESNLVSVLTFHIYMILGLDAETFELNAGEEYFEQAQSILNYSAQTNFNGWKAEDGQQTRYTLIDNILSPVYKEYRDVMYRYHRLGLDVMSTDPKNGKQVIADAIGSLRTMNNRRPNSFILRVFFDAKAEEIEQIFSDGPSVQITDVVDSLNKIAPTHAAKWRNITF